MKDIYSKKWRKWFEFPAEPSRFLKCISPYFRQFYNSPEDVVRYEDYDENKEYNGHDEYNYDEYN